MTNLRELVRRDNKTVQNIFLASLLKTKLITWYITCAQKMQLYNNGEDLFRDDNLNNYCKRWMAKTYLLIAEI